MYNTQYYEHENIGDFDHLKYLKWNVFGVSQQLFLCFSYWQMKTFDLENGAW